MTIPTARGESRRTAKCATSLIPGHAKRLLLWTGVLRLSFSWLDLWRRELFRVHVGRLFRVGTSEIRCSCAAIDDLRLYIIPRLLQSSAGTLRSYCTVHINRDTSADSDVDRLLSSFHVSTSASCMKSLISLTLDQACRELRCLSAAIDQDNGALMMLALRRGGSLFHQYSGQCCVCCCQR
jgi:hypothetical protein